MLVAALAPRAPAGSGKILSRRGTRSTACRSPPPTRGPPLATTEPSSEQPTVCWQFHLLTSTRALQLARMEQSSGLQTEEIPGLARRVEQPTICLPFHLPTQITEQLLAGTG